MNEPTFVAPLRNALPSLVAAALAFLSCDIARGVDVVAETQPEETPEYLRVASEPGRSVALEIACREFVPREGEGPSVTLVGVAHVADLTYYRSLQRVLDAFDLVLYESVMPEGAAGAAGDDDAQRIRSTQSAADFLARLVAAYHMRNGDWPGDFDELRSYASTRDSRLSHFLDRASIDAWGNPFTIETEESADGDVSFHVLSLGADGAPGGDGAMADIRSATEHSSPPDQVKGDALQAQLASALNLAFQLDAIDYDRSNWRCSDMSIGQVQDSLAAKGSNFTFLEESLAGTSMPAKVVRVLLGLVQIADSFMGGAVSDMFKVAMIEMLADEEMIDLSMQQFDPAMGEVIVVERNLAVMDDLQDVLAAPGDVKTIGVFYGAAHMSDLENRIADQFDYVPAETNWYRAIEIDLQRSAITEAEVNQMRMMIRRTLRQMSRMERSRDAQTKPAD